MRSCVGIPLNNLTSLVKLVSRFTEILTSGTGPRHSYPGATDTPRAKQHRPPQIKSPTKDDVSYLPTHYLRPHYKIQSLVSECVVLSDRELCGKHLCVFQKSGCTSVGGGHKGLKRTREPVTKHRSVTQGPHTPKCFSPDPWSPTST